MRILVNGSDTFVATGGKDFDSSLPAIVFLHGAGMDHSVWALLARAFARSLPLPIGPLHSLTLPVRKPRGWSVTRWDRWWRWKRLRGIPIK
jgi:pimeloyl-ACP methyl ester carboxylesterase